MQSFELHVDEAIWKVIVNKGKQNADCCHGFITVVIGIIIIIILFVLFGRVDVFILDIVLRVNGAAFL